jgi:hypothetical protein
MCNKHCPKQHFVQSITQTTVQYLIPCIPVNLDHTHLDMYDKHNFIITEIYGDVVWDS